MTARPAVVWEGKGADRKDLSLSYVLITSKASYFISDLLPDWWHWKHENVPAASMMKALYATSTIDPQC